MMKQRVDWQLVIVLLMAGAIFLAVLLVVRRWQGNTQSLHDAPVATSGMK
jgi:hypothetical protein